MLSCKLSVELLNILTITQMTYLSMILRCNVPVMAKIVVLDAFCGIKNKQKSISEGASPRTPLGELTVLPQTHSWWGGGLAAPLPKNPTSRLGASGLARPCLLTFDYLPPPLII